jgi:uncharacterized protein (UPF0179 family)
MVIAMVPKELAKLNQIFKFSGERPECKTCPHRDICVQNLKPGRYYKIVEVRDVVHECPLYGIEMKVVDVVEVGIPMVVDHPVSPGEIVRANVYECSNKKCPYYAMCQNPEVEPGERYEVESVEGELKCPLGKKMYLVYVKKKRFPF